MINKPGYKKEGAPTTADKQAGGSASASGKDLLGRVPPHSADAEAAVLGAILRRGDAIHNVADIIKADDFYLPTHQLIFSAFIDLLNKKQLLTAFGTLSLFPKTIRPNKKHSCLSGTPFTKFIPDINTICNKTDSDIKE